MPESQRPLDPPLSLAEASEAPLKLSIVIPWYNERVTFAALVAAVLVSPVPAKELTLADDGSTDGTRDLRGGALRPGVD